MACQSKYFLIARQLSLAIAILWLVIAASAQSEHPIYEFKGGVDSDAPTAGLIADSKGNLYGTTTGFDINGGTVFELTKPSGSGPWTETILHRFPANSTDGRTPEAGVIFDSKGNLYGTTTAGGTNDQGVIFELSPPSVTGKPWTETILYSFVNSSNTTDGNVGGGLIFKGTSLYGTTIYGGQTGGGVFFSLTPTGEGTWTYTVQHNFTGQPDGSEPNVSCEPLVNDKLGNLYGVTAYGGVYGGGAVFEMSPPAAKGDSWTETILYSFNPNTTDAQAPAAGLIFDSSGNLYGTGLGGGTLGYGAVFELSPPAVSGDAWTESVIYSFTDATDGSDPWAKLVIDKSGNLYGTTLTGSVYELSPPAAQGDSWSETTLYNFPGFTNDGQEPRAGLLLTTQGNLFGTTYAGGSGGYGIVFEIHP
jgi:uncharacterized repeat protein (TIGR03803 family)